MARAVAEAVNRQGGVMTVEDLAAHTSTRDTPLHTDYHGLRVWQMPPNGQGIVALMALNMLESCDVPGVCACVHMCVCVRVCACVCVNSIVAL